MEILVSSYFNDQTFYQLKQIDEVKDGVDDKRLKTDGAVAVGIRNIAKYSYEMTV